MKNRNIDDDPEEPQPIVEKAASKTFPRFQSRNRNQADDLGELPPTNKRGAVKMFGKLIGKAAKNAPEATTKTYAVEKLGHIVTEAADYPEDAIPLPKKKKKGVIDRVDRFLVRVIAPQVKRQYEQYSDQWVGSLPGPKLCPPFDSHP